MLLAVARVVPCGVATTAPRRATLADLEGLPENVVLWQAGSYVVVAIHDGEETVRAPPFDAIELELPVLWRR